MAGYTDQLNFGHVEDVDTGGLEKHLVVRVGRNKGIGTKGAWSNGGVETRATLESDSEDTD